MDKIKIKIEGIEYELITRTMADAILSGLNYNRITRDALRDADNGFLYTTVLDLESGKVRGFNHKPDVHPRSSPTHIVIDTTNPDNWDGMYNTLFREYKAWLETLPEIQAEEWTALLDEIYGPSPAILVYVFRGCISQVRAFSTFQEALLEYNKLIENENPRPEDDLGIYDKNGTMWEYYRPEEEPDERME